VVGAESTSARAWTSSVMFYESLDSSVNLADTVCQHIMLEFVLVVQAYMLQLLQMYVQ
jgi:hypothetical protein